MMPAMPSQRAYETLSVLLVLFRPLGTVGDDKRAIFRGLEFLDPGTIALKGRERITPFVEDLVLWPAFLFTQGRSQDLFDRPKRLAFLAEALEHLQIRLAHHRAICDEDHFVDLE